MNREWLARAPLPLLALSAAWGVWQFQMQFTPWFVALLSALAFESVYLSLALVPVVDSRRATVISITAVVVSVVYNTLSSLFVLSYLPHTGSEARIMMIAIGTRMAATYQPRLGRNMVDSLLCVLVSLESRLTADAKLGANLCKRQALYVLEIDNLIVSGLS